jgi:hypothetical protein
MSSSFSFAALYMTRFEQQQTGLTWDNIWDSPLEDDETNFALAIIFIAGDTVVYLGRRDATNLKHNFKLRIRIDS